MDDLRYWYKDTKLLIAAKERYKTFAGIQRATGTHQSTLRLEWERQRLPKLTHGPKPKQPNMEALEDLYKEVYGGEA